MNKEFIIISILLLVIALCTLLLLSTRKPTSISTNRCDGNYNKFTADEEKILAGADERIEKHRMGIATLDVVNSNGDPIPTAQIKIEQTNHEFLFGANHDYGVWKEIASTKMGVSTKNTNLSEAQIDDYLNKFNAIANYINIPASWAYYEPRNNEYQHDLFNNIFDWVDKQKQFTITSGPRIWNIFTPNWVPDDCSELSIELEKRVRHFISNFKGRYKYYTVVNEAANPYRQQFSSDKITKCMKEVGKIEWTKKWFSLARELDGEASLIVNEVSILPEQGFPELLNGLKNNAGKPLYDIIGIQSHMHNKIWALDRIWEACEGYSSFGVPLHFTEVTVLSGSPISGKHFGKNTTAKGECQQAEYVVNFYKTLFSHPSVESILWWNFGDYMAWKDAPAGLIRKDMSPKPSYTALMDLIYREWWTNSETTSSANGQAKFKGFFGNYNVSVTTESGESKSFSINFSKNGIRQFQLIL